MDTRDEIRRKISDIEDEIGYREMYAAYDEDEIQKLNDEKEELKSNFQKLADKEIEKIFNAVSLLKELGENATEDYTKVIEDLEKKIAIIKIELGNLGLSTNEIQKFENEGQTIEQGESEKEEQELEVEDIVQSEEGQEEEVQQDNPEASQTESEPEVDEYPMEIEERNRFIRMFKVLLARLEKIMGIKEGIANKLAERNIDVEHFTNQELESQTAELAQEEQQTESTEAHEENELQEDTKQPTSQKETIIGRFKQVMAYRRQIKQIEKNVKKEMRKRNLEIWIDDKKEMAHETFENVKDSIIHSEIVQGAKNMKEAVVQGAIDRKTDIVQRFTDKKAWAEQNMEEAKETVIQGAKTAGTIVLGAGALTVEAMGAAKDALILGGRQVIQNLVMTGQNTANMILDKVQESTQIKEAQVKSMQYDLEMGI